MAEGGRGNQLGGHEYAFVSPVPPDLVCISCNLPVKDPTIWPACTHIFCRTCVRRIIQSVHPRCPIDKCYIPIEGYDYLVKNLKRDAKRNRHIQHLHVKCPNEGCTWTGMLNTVESHLNVCKKVLVKRVNVKSGKSSPREEIVRNKQHKMKDQLSVIRKKIEHLENSSNDQTEFIDYLFARMNEIGGCINELRGNAPIE